MAYTRISYKDFAPYRIIEAEGGIKRIVWDKVSESSELKDFCPHFQDERTKVILQTDTCMPFDLYVIPAGATRRWCGDYLRKRPDLRRIFNCIYLLCGHDYIYAGKSINGDRILGHIVDEEEKTFEYQFLFAPNNENPYTMAYWTSDFMSYLESLLIERINPVGQANPYCKNLIQGKKDSNSARDLNLNEDKEDFAKNVIDLVLSAFSDISYSDYLVPDISVPVISFDLIQQPVDENNEIVAFWKEIIRLSRTKYENYEFGKLKPSKYHWNGINMNKNKKIPYSSIGCAVTQSTCRVELIGWPGKRYAESNLDVYDKLYSFKDDIERELGCCLKWDRNDDEYTTRISISKNLSFRNTDNGTVWDITSFFAEYVQKFYDILPKYYKR